MRRRTLIFAGAAGSAAALLAWSRLERYIPASRALDGFSPEQTGAAGLAPDPAGLLDLPEGFRYRVLQRAGERMTDGYRVPGRADGMACFLLPDGSWALMCNHEVPHWSPEQGPWDPGSKPPRERYSDDSFGAVTRVRIDPKTGTVLGNNLALAGTDFNCAGGPSPWGWLSCEESSRDGHGHVFLCDPRAERLQPPRRIDAYGRFVHEAVAVDPVRHIAYMTEDRFDGCLYRFLPTRADRPFEGRLQAMAVRGKPGLDTGSEMPPQTQRVVHWLDLPPVPATGGPELRSLAAERGAARVWRGEGVWYAGGHVYFTATVGGSGQRGQIFELDTRNDDANLLRVVTEGNDRNHLVMPDNLTMAPWGELVVAEDGPGRDHLLRVGLDGRVRPLARNARALGELAGVCFSPDGRELYLNMQEQGLTLAVRGPWPEPGAG